MPAKETDFLFFKTVKNGPEADSASYSIGSGNIFQRKAAEA
jgi:hypothetical protein